MTDSVLIGKLYKNFLARLVLGEVLDMLVLSDLFEKEFTLLSCVIAVAHTK